jgi:hypothetical protein
MTATSRTFGCDEDHVLDLGRVDVLAARDDHVLLAVVDVDEASASTVATSPVWSQPSRIVSAVASGRFQ